jgi:hypothetical protein
MNTSNSAVLQIIVMRLYDPHGQYMNILASHFTSKPPLRSRSASRTGVLDVGTRAAPGAGQALDDPLDLRVTTSGTHHQATPGSIRLVFPFLSQG